MDKQREKCMDFWKKAGATEAMVLACIAKKGVEDITIDDLVFLRGCATAMKDEGIGADRILSRSDVDAPKNRLTPKSPTE